MPGLVVSTPSGISTKDSVGGSPSFQRVDQIVVECYLTQDLTAPEATPELRDEGVAAALDAFEQEVIDALLCDPGWLSLFASVEGIRVQQGEGVTMSETNRRRGASLITFDVKFRVTYEPPKVDDFEEIALDLDMIDPGSSPRGPDGLIDIAADPVSVNPPSDLWANFGSTTEGDLDALAAANVLFSLQGNYSVGVLVRGRALSEYLGLLASAGDISPSIRFHESAKKSQFSHLNFVGGSVASEVTDQDGLDDDIHLIIWTSKDSGSNADLYSQVDGNPTVYYGFGSDPRQADGEPWNTSGPGSVRVGLDFIGQIGWIGFARRFSVGINNVAAALAGTGGATIWAAYQSGGRRALDGAWETANSAGASVYSHVLDGVTPPDVGAATPIVLTDVTYVSVES